MDEFATRGSVRSVSHQAADEVFAFVSTSVAMQVDRLHSESLSYIWW